MIKIVQIVRLNTSLGGIAQVAMSYDKVASLHKEKIEIKTIIDYNPTKNVQLPDGKDYIFTKNSSKKINQIKLFLNKDTRKLIEHCDICILHTDTCRFTVKLIRFIFRKKIKIVGIIHNNNRIKKERNYDHIICLNEDQQKKITSKKTRTKTSILHNPLSDITYSTDKIIDKITSKNNLNNNINIVMISNLIEKKNISRGIYEFNHLVSNYGEYANSSLTIAGDGPLKNELDDLVDKLSLNEKVKLIGWADTSLKSKLLLKADFFWHTSLIEPFGIVLLEAGLYGCNVISSNNEGAKTINIKTNHITLIDKESCIGEFANMTVIQHKNYNAQKLINTHLNIIENYSHTQYKHEFFKIMNSIIE